MSVTAMQETAAAPRLAATLLPIMGVVFVAFLVIGVAMPILPLHVHDGLGFGTFVVGLVAGSQFAASLISRPWAGHYSDSRGAKRGVTWPTGGRGVRVALSVVAQLQRNSADLGRDSLARARVARRGGELHHHGFGELGTGARRSPQHGQGHRVGGLGDVRCLRNRRAGGLRALCCLRLCGDSDRYCGGSAGALLLVAPLPTVAPVQHTRSFVSKVIGAVWVPGLGSALGSVGFGAVTTFVALLFAAEGGPTDGSPTRHTPSLSFWRGYSSAIWRTRSAERRSRWSSHWSRPSAKR